MTSSAERDEATFAESFRRDVPPVLRYARRRVVADSAWDVVNETFLVAWRQRDQRPGTPEEQLPWLYTIARNVIRNADRSARRQLNLADRVATVERGTTGADPADTVVDRVPGEHIERALWRLRPDDQEILRLVGWENLDLSATAAALQITYGTAKVRLHRARRRLQQALDDLAGEDSATTALRPLGPAIPAFVKEN